MNITINSSATRIALNKTDERRLDAVIAICDAIARHSESPSVVEHAKKARESLSTLSRLVKSTEAPAEAGATATATDNK